MTDKIADDPTIKAKPVPAPTPVRPVKSGRGLASFALLIALGAAGGSGYLWYLWQQEKAAQATRLEAAIKQAASQVTPEIQTLKTQLQQLQASNENQQIKGQILGLTGDVQPLKNAMELQKGENEILKKEMSLLREGHEAYKTENQKHKETLDNQLREQQSHLSKLDEQLHNVRLANTGLANDLDTLRTVAAKGGDVNAFPLAEVDYLLRLADTKLKLERNLPAARLALDTAQTRLKTVEEPALESIKTMLGEAIGSLRGVQLPDYSGLAHKLAEMQKQVDTLPVKINSQVSDIKNRVKPSDTPAIDQNTERSLLDRTGEAIWNQFKDIVVIRRMRSDAPPLIAMEEEFFLRQNLQLELESMRMSLLRGDAQSYQDSREVVDQWLKTYFDTHDSRVVAFQKEIEALQAVPFNVYIPDLSGLTQTFNELMAQRQPIRTIKRAEAVNSGAEAEQ